MLTILPAIIALLAATPDTLEPLYVLEYPGVVFVRLAPKLDPPVEGALTRDAGVVASAPNAEGIEYRLLYWREDLPPNVRKADWLINRLLTVMPPDLATQLVFGTPDWMEGSISSPHREEGSLGLMPVLNFNLITDEGRVAGRGRACAFFRNGYSTLFYVIAPMTAPDVRPTLDWMVDAMYLKTNS